ncbi:uncharacterized protein ACA1_197720 [Acanthamoeba castellanii str. Neff]|uniref:Inner membrane protein YgaP-like transmembrane domain-containing protein n=1 Tax=Acanthamoeba castellanii (strain ATCC 30010 / Neff) TaxID=1257118 RepID=L8H2Z6_ACACF|nr:uncharacterized protein ACA1_197720 [Acanthamoeba castellanii str. Neff]ELR19592.1 hypothetical protein ACA1_197720 [Acanthamoeba castellanii str. Neff]
MLQREKVSPVRNRSRDRTTMDHQQGAGGSADGGATAAAPRTALPEKPTRVDDEIRRKTVDRVAYFKDMSPELMTTRLGDLDREWTIHRLVALVVGLVSAGGLLGGWWYGHHSCYLIALVSSLVLLQHAITGWSPLVPPLRLLGVRTEKEVNAERIGLRLARGDFAQVGQSRADEIVARDLSAASAM